MINHSFPKKRIGARIACFFFSLAIWTGSSSLAGTPQSIDFPAIADRSDANATVALDAVASSQLPVSYTVVSTTGAATVSGSTLNLKGIPDSITVTATQAGDSIFDPAQPVTRTFAVGLASQRFVKIFGSSTAQHGIGIRADGSLWTWGDNLRGQLGIGTQEDSKVPVRVGTESDWSAAGGGITHTLAVKFDGSLWAWGSNGSGQLGNGTTSMFNQLTPLRIGTTNDWEKVVCGLFHSLALKTDGTLWAWGSNSSGQVGSGSGATTQTSPVQIGASSTWLAIAAGEQTSLALRSDGTLWAWGSNSLGSLGIGSTGGNSPVPVQIGTDSDWASISSGSAFSGAVKEDGSLWLWGRNGSSQLGDGTTTDRNTPAQLGTDFDWVSIACGTSFAFARKADGTLWGWGGNSNGELGIGDTEKRITPEQVGTATNWSSCVTAMNFTIALKSDGTLWSWGNNENGELGNGFTTIFSSPRPLQDYREWTQIDFGTRHAVAIRADGSLWAWGMNYYGQLGDGTRIRRSQPVRIGLDTDWVSVSCGASHSLAIRADGTLWAWGSNAHGQLGDSTTIDRLNPTQIGSETNWTRISAGGTDFFGFSHAIRQDGTLWAWGYDGSGQLGDGTGTLFRSSPFQIGSGASWKQVACGGEHTIALRSDGTLWGWGNNLLRQLGDGTTTNRNTPVKIGNVDTWSAIDSSSNHTLALLLDGSLWAWGSNRSGQLGRGNTNSVNFPTRVGTSNNWQDISTGNYHSAAIQSDGTLWSWGENLDGQLGNGTSTASLSPLQVGTDTDWEAIRCGPLLTTSVKKNGNLWGFGNNVYGQLGHIEDDFIYRIWPVAQPQTINHSSLPPLLTRQQVLIDATATSGLPVKIAVSGPGTLSGNSLTVTGPGTLKLKLSQDGDKTWRASSVVEVTATATDPVPQISITGNQIPILNGDSTPRTADFTEFGPVTTGAGSIPRSFNIVNSGTANLELTGTSPDLVTLSGPGGAAFQIITQPASTTIAPNGGTGSFTMIFDPSLDGEHLAVVTVASNAPGIPSYSFTVRGTGTGIDGAIGPPGSIWSTGGDAPWFSQNEMSHDGIAAVQNGLLAPGGVSWLETNVTGPANLSFRWKSNFASAEYTFRVEIPGGQLIFPVGGSDWQQETIEVPAGSGHVRWHFQRDPSSTAVGGRIWVDDVVVTPATAPAVGMTVIDQIGAQTARVTTNLVSAGGRAISARGVVWSTVAAPTLADSSITDAGNGVGPYALTMANLNEGSTYFARAFATNNLGTSYGESHFFTTDTNVPLIDGIAVPIVRGILAGDRHVFRFEFRRPTLATLTTENGTGLQIEIFSASGQLIESSDGLNDLVLSRFLGTGVYELHVIRPPASGAVAQSYTLRIDGGTEALSRPDLTIGRNASEFEGINVYTPNRQNLIMISKRAAPINVWTSISNAGDRPDILIARGSSGDRFFAVTHLDAGGNRTAQLIAGTYMTPELDRNDAPVSLRSEVNPNKKLLSRKKRGRPVSLRKALQLVYFAVSESEPSLSDSATVGIQTR